MVDSWAVIARVGGTRAVEGLCDRLCLVRGVLEEVGSWGGREEIVKPVEAGDGGRFDFAEE